tara:strand:- start:2730 stop:7652 length:4923 start_codon:yes stop_codon:yes gene_type:complete
MGLSRLDNFLKNTKGEILYVDPNNLDSTDSVQNQGNSLARPFKTLQRALIEAARFSYQKGVDNDRFGKTTIVLYPGEHIVDNRPGWIPIASNNYRLRSGATSGNLSPFDTTTNFDLRDDDNILYKLNSIHGGVIVPRGTSIVGMDLRKTKIIPRYVPDPTNDQIERSAIFRVTGACYFWQFSIFDGDTQGTVYKDYTTNKFIPNFSHHKLTCFEYADGVNDIDIDDDFISGSDGEVEKTDLELYYEKVGNVYGTLSGRAIFPEQVGDPLDIEAKIDEYRIVGSTGSSVGISSIFAGDSTTSTTTVTVELETALPDIDTDSPIRVNGVAPTGYDGAHIVTEVVSDTRVKYEVQNPPANAKPSAADVAGATLALQVDTVTSASPYIFNISLRSVYGMCGMHADGDKASGFKSMVVAQFTGIGLQKDNNAFVKYNTTTGLWEDQFAAGNDNLSADSRAKYKPEYENFHIKSSNSAILQLVSIFAIGYAKHFVAESGSDQSITNSNSNFGQIALNADGFKKDAFTRDDVGYISHIIPPKELEGGLVTVEFDAIDIGITTTVAAAASPGIGTTSRLYLLNQKNSKVPPVSVLDGYRFGANNSEELKVNLSFSGVTTAYSARVIMDGTEGTSLEESGEKVTNVARTSVGINSISTSIFTLEEDHKFKNGESIRVLSENGHLPDGLTPNTIYFAVTSESDSVLNTKQIKIAQNKNDAINNNPLTINSKGGALTVVSRVSDKKAGDLGHPIQFDSAQGQWYVNVSSASTENNLYSTLVGVGTTVLGTASPRTYIERTNDPRAFGDTVYRARYVIPSDSATIARPPVEGYVMQESNLTTPSTTTEVEKYFSASTQTLTNSTELRNPRFIADATWSGTTATIRTELPHELVPGNEVEVINVVSTANTTGSTNLGFNGTFTVTAVRSRKEFQYTLTANPGTFTSDTITRNTSLPSYKRKRYNETLVVYRVNQIQEYIPNKQGGVYDLLVVSAGNKPVVSPFTNLRYSQPIANLYPQLNRDNPASDVPAADCFASSDIIGEVVVNDPRNSLTKETLASGLYDFGVGIGISNVVSNATGTAHTITSRIEHGFNRATKLSITTAGTKYGNGGSARLLNAKLEPASTGAGKNVTALIDINSAGEITNAEIMDGGSACSVGDSFNVVGVATTAGHVVGVVSITQIYSNVGDVIRLNNVSGKNNGDYNQLYRITSIAAGDAYNIQVSSATTVSSSLIGSASGIGITLATPAFYYEVGHSIDVQTLDYNQVTGVGIVTCTEAHGLFVDNKVHICGADQGLYNGNFIVKSVGTTTSFTIDIGIGSISYPETGTIRVFPTGFVSQGGASSPEDENTAGRMVTSYAGITTTLKGISGTGNALLTTDEIEIDTDYLDIRIGDYLQIDEEIVRVKETVTSDIIKVFRGTMGTQRQSHVAGEVVKRVRPRQVELRRNSILRASGHTFEYLGFGPGNYSTALPQRQDRIISPIEEVLSQAHKQDGGVVVYTGMNNDGSFYIGNKKVSSSTGKEATFDAPVPTTVGEDLGPNLNIGFDVLTPVEATITRSIRVEGGGDATVSSRFDGPVIFNNKITSNSLRGIEAQSIFIQGDATVSRKHTVGISTPVVPGNPGDIVYNANPTNGGYTGWIYTTNNEWKTFGDISS